MESVWWDVERIFSTYESFLYHSYRQERDKTHRGWSLEEASNRHQKTAVELVEYLEGYTDRPPLVFDEAHANFKMVWDTAKQAVAA